MEIQQNSLIWQSNNVPTVNLDGEVAMMNIEKGKYYGMDLIATRIWNLISEPKRFRSIVETLMHEYEVEKKICENDVEQFLNRLFKEGLIEIK